MRHRQSMRGVWGIFIMAGVIAGGTAAVTVADAGQSDEDGFVSIFDGTSLDGWRILYRESGRPLPREDAFRVVDGLIECVGHNGYWLRYEKEQLENFVLRLEVKLTPKANSGVIVHATERGVPWQSGFEVQIFDDYGRPPTKHGMGSIYDVVTPMYNESRPPGEWNEMEVTYANKQVQVVVNGLKVIDTDFSKMTCPIGKFRFPYSTLQTKGYLALQDHGDQLWFRNIRLKKLPSDYRLEPATPEDCEEGFESIMPGPGGQGWEVYEPGGRTDPHVFVLINDFIRAAGTARHENFYRYKEPLRNYILRGEYRTEAKANSGFILQTKKEGIPWETGFEVQILEDYGEWPTRHSEGSIYDVTTPMFNASNPAGHWNTFEITHDRGQVRVVLNGWKVIDTDFNDLTTPRGKFTFPYSQMPREGYLCLQDHGDVVDFRRLRLKRLPD